MKRPLGVSAIALIWGIILADGRNSHGWGLMLVILSLFIMLLLYHPTKATSSRFLLMAIPFLLTGYTLHSINISHHDKILLPWEGRIITAEGRVLDEPEFIEGKTRFTLDIQTIDSDGESTLKNARIRVTLYADDPVSEIQYGSIVRLVGEIKHSQGKRNLGGFNTQKYLAAQEISGTLNVSEKALTILEGQEASWLKSAGYKIRHGILQSISNCLPKKEASVLAGMLIGYTKDMPEEMEEDFRRAGLSHVMAVSGANIAFLLLPLLWLLKRLGFNRRWSSAIAFPMMIFYVFATGMEASVVRAAIMAGVTLIGMLFWRKTDIYCSMAASAIIILIKNSYMLYDLGFILSFAATLSLAIFHKPLLDRLSVKIPKSIRSTLAATLAAQLGVIPVVAYCFNTFSVVSVLSNLLVVPLTGFLTLLGALLAIVGNLALSLGQLLGQFTRIVVDILLFLTENIAAIPWAEIGLATPSLLFVMIYYLVLLYVRYWHPRLPNDVARPVLAGILVLCGTLVVFMCVPSRSLRIYFADVGQGDCVLIRTPQGKNIIIDGGGSINDEKGSYAGERIVVPLLYDLNMAEIDLMIATHSHADHIGGLKSVIDKVEVKRLVVAEAPDIEMRELTDYAEKKGVPIERVKEGKVLFKERELLLKALYPFEETWRMPMSATTNANELSLVTRIDYGEFSALFTGDIGVETEKRLLEDGAMLRCDLLKVAHHGSKYSSDEVFLNTVNPRLAAISVGQNRYGHPSPEALTRLIESGSTVYQTLESGGILVEINEDDSQMCVTTVIGN